jgi:hypothetical protein
METIAVLRQASFQPTSSVASYLRSAMIFSWICLLNRMRQSWSFGPGAAYSAAK